MAMALVFLADFRAHFTGPGGECGGDSAGVGVIQHRGKYTMASRSSLTRPGTISDSWATSRKFTPHADFLP